MGKKKKAPGKPKKLWEIYDVSSGGVSRKSGFCKKCGPGFFLSSHKDRFFCGKCKYMERSSPVGSKEKESSG